MVYAAVIYYWLFCCDAVTGISSCYKLSKGAMIQATENGLVWYEQIAALQAELSKERQHSREQAGRIAVLADQAQRLQLAQMQPQQIEDCVAPAEPERQQPEPPRSWWSRFWSK